MNHYGIGQIKRDGTIELPGDILSPLSITQQVMVWGVLYNNTDKNADYLCEQYNLVLSPSPCQLWGKTARLVVTTPHDCGVFKTITELLKKHNSSILVSEASRSAFHHDTWTMIISFDGLETIEYDDGKKIFSDILPRIALLEKDLSRLVEDEFFYIEENDEKLSKGFNLYPHHANSYFCNHYQKSNHDQNNKTVYSEMYEFNCGPQNSLKPTGTGGKSFCSLLDTLAIDNVEDKESICYVYAEMDTIDQNLRLALIDSSTAERFYELGVSYTRFNNEPESSLGVTHTLLNAFPENMNIWAISSKMDSYSELREKSRVYFLLFNESTENSRASIQNNLEKIPELCASNLPANVELKNPKIRSLEAILAKNKVISTMENKPKHVFISYSSNDTKDAKNIQNILKNHNIDCFLAKDGLAQGDLFEESIRKKIMQAYELIVICTPNSINSSWVKKELGAAWVLKKRVVPIVNMMQIDDLPEELNKAHAVYLSDAVQEGWKYPEQLLQRIFDNDLLLHDD